MTFDYGASAELNYSCQKVSVARVSRLVIGALPPQQRQFGLPSKSSQQYARLAHGCRWEKSASTAMTSGVYTRAPVTRGAVACGNRGEICKAISTEKVVTDSATCSVRDR